MPVNVYDVLRAGINFSGSGSTAVITGVTAQRIIIRSLYIVVNGATTITLVDGSTNVTTVGPFDLPVNGIIDLKLRSIAQAYYCSQTPGNSFSLNSSSAVNVSGFIEYSQG